MTTNRRIQKIRLKSDKNFHHSIVQAILEDPVCLGIYGLDSNALIWKASEYHYMHGRGHRSEGKYEKFPGPDLVFFYHKDGFHFLVLEVKGSILGKGHVEAERQLNRAESYFTGFWKAVVINEIKTALLDRFRESVYIRVFLSLAEVTKELFGSGYNVMPHRTKIQLGKLAISRSENKILFMGNGSLVDL